MPIRRRLATWLIHNSPSQWHFPQGPALRAALELGRWTCPSTDRPSVATRHQSSVPQRACAGPEPARHRFVDYGRARSWLQIIVVEVPAPEQFDSHRAEVPRGHGVDREPGRPFVRTCLPSFNSHSLVGIAPEEELLGARPRSRRERADTVPRFAKERRGRRPSPALYQTCQ